jgi:inactivated superfamily I helicase
VGARGLRIEKCKPKAKAAPASGVAEHVHTATQHTRAIAEAAAAELAPTDVASAQARMSENVMHDSRGSYLQAHSQGQGPTLGVALAFGLHSLVLSLLEQFAIMPTRLISYSCIARPTRHS